MEIIVRVGSRVPEIHNIAMALYKRCRELRITLIVQWKSRDRLLVHHFGHLTLEVDCIVEATNKKCSRYYSGFPDSDAERRNFFGQKLDSFTAYYCVPPSFITASLLPFSMF